ncbi:MAG: hypothetical protein JNK27_04305 [Chitinophagaceae bacterium]|nr:hypothetical protein [Chitinophagaceae bacterium]
MRKISTWAKAHKWPARIILVVSLLLLNITGILTGLLLKDLSVIIPGSVFLLTILIYVWAILSYPARSTRSRYAPGQYYTKQKTRDFILAATAFVLFVCISNNNKIVPASSLSLQAATNAHPSDSQGRAYKPVWKFSASMKDENGKMLKWKERKKLLKEQIRGIKKSNELSNGGKVALTILAVLAALGLLYLVASLACNLSCSGSDAAAVIVGLGGGALVIVLLVVAIRAIYNKKRRELRKQEKKAADEG